MTHPTNDTGSSGPGRTSVLNGLAAHERANAAIAAELAGSRGTHATPMTTAERVGHYRQQNGGRPLTAAQRRRIAKAELRAEVRAA